MTDIQKKLKPLRIKIDTVDKSILKLLEKRMKLVAQVAKAKRSHKIGAIMYPDREIQVAKKIFALSHKKLPQQPVQRIWREMMAMSVQAQADFVAGCINDMDVASLLGVATPVKKFSNIKKLTEALKRRKIQCAVLPLQDTGKPWWLTASLHGLFINAIAPLTLFDGNQPSALVLTSYPLKAMENPVFICMSYKKSVPKNIKILSMYQDAKLVAVSTKKIPEDMKILGIAPWPFEIKSGK